MRTSRILASSAFAVSAALAGIASCSSSDTGRHTNTDAPAGSGGIDAPGSNQQTDAPTNTGGGDGIGKACTPGSGTGPNQGDCATGYICLSLMGGTHAWCSKTCTPGQGTDTCSTGYTGPGLAQCMFQVGPMGATMNYCGVMCEDDSGTNAYCPANKCTGACPSTPSLACTAPLTNTMMTVVAKACQ